MPGDAELAAALAAADMNNVQFDRERRTISFSRPGVEINLGAVGKGYALDRIGSRLRRLGYDQHLLSAGSSSLLVVGTPHWDDAWRVALRHPLDRTRTIAVVRLSDSGLSTSGLAEQSFECDGKRYGHVIDPRTGRPVEGMLQASALAPSAEEAEALSTAFFVNGVEWAEGFCRRRPEIGGVILPEPESGGELVLHLIGVAQDRVDLPESDL
jgi:thiamine biosynthesis lipoprotein